MAETTTNRVEAFYDQEVEREWGREERHPMEFATTRRAMQEFIPPNSAVLDVGGGPGRYSIGLAKEGHRVTLLDLSGRNVGFARRKAAEAGVRLAGAVQGNALDLNRFNASSIDVVLLMGPLYHLIEIHDRERALAEALRVLRPGGVLFASFITRYAFLLDSLRSPAVLPEPALVDRLLESGVKVVGPDNPGFTDAYFADPGEIAPWFERHGLVPLRLAAVDPFVVPVEPAVNALAPADFERWVDICYRLGPNPHVWGAAEHLLYVGRKT